MIGKRVRPREVGIGDILKSSIRVDCQRSVGRILYEVDHQITIGMIVVGIITKNAGD